MCDYYTRLFHRQTIGLTVRTLMRMQMNIQVKNPHSDKTLNPMKDKTVLPMVWVEMVIIFEFPSSANQFSFIRVHIS